MKLLEKNVGKTLFDINSNNIFLDSPPRVMEIKTKINKCVLNKRASKAVLVVKNPPVSARFKRYGFDPWVGKMPWRSKWKPIPVFLPGEFPWTEEPGGLQSMGLQRVRYYSATEHTREHWNNLKASQSI